MTRAALCELCLEDGGELLFSDAHLRVVLVADPAYPGFCRVIWNQHVKEMSDLSVESRNHLMEAVWRVETAIRQAMSPDKINLASLGNMTPHLHWHVIPRYADDAHFPSPVWAEAKRSAHATTLAARAALLPGLRLALADLMQTI